MGHTVSIFKPRRTRLHSRGWLLYEVLDLAWTVQVPNLAPYWIGLVLLHNLLLPYVNIAREGDAKKALCCDTVAVAGAAAA